jgi:hypothetical protein
MIELPRETKAEKVRAEIDRLRDDPAYGDRNSPRHQETLDAIQREYNKLAIIQATVE